MKTINQEILKNLIKSMEGQELTVDNIIKNLKLIGFDTIGPESISIVPGYRIDENSGWITVSIIENSIRVTVTNNAIILS